jgi:hypothetical protein
MAVWFLLAFPAGKLLKADVRAQQQIAIIIGKLQQSCAEYSQWNRAEFTCCVYQVGSLLTTWNKSVKLWSANQQRKQIVWVRKIKADI